MIFGAGERSVPMNRRGYKLGLYNNPAYGYSLNAENLNYSVPFIISSNGYGIFFDNPSRGYLDIGKHDPGILEYGATSGELSFYVIHGKNIDEILRRYQDLVGKQPIPARWVFGNLMSRFGYRSEAQLREILAQMKEKKFPVEAVIIDLFWFGDSIKGTMGNLDWVNKKAWPDPAKMIADFNRDNIKTILITEPFVLKSTPNYEPSKKFHAVDSAGNPFVLQDFYFGQGGLLDIFRNETQDWFWKKYKMQINKGVAGWWGDLGEPEKHPEGIYHSLKDLGFNRKFKADEVHNIYGHYWDKMLYDRYAKEFPNKRLFNLNRSGYAGSPRYGVFPWSGDVSRSWDGLRAQLPLMLGMSISGVPYIHADAGGFAGGDGDEELYTRWLQFAAFTPVFRPHGTAFGDLEPGVKNIPSEPALWSEKVQENVRAAIDGRYALTPYNYTLAYEQEKFGKPLVRPMFYYEQADSNLFIARDQFFWGDQILVAPVIEKGVKSRRIYLPEGRWYRYSDNENFSGAQWIDQPTHPASIPVFIKAGSILPKIEMEPGTNLENYSTKSLTLTYFPSKQETSYTLYDDDGKTKDALLKGAFELINFKAESYYDHQVLKSLSMAVSSNNGRFIGRPVERQLELIIPWPGGQAGDKINVDISGRSFTSALLKAESNIHPVLKISFRFKDEPLSISVVNSQSN